MNFTVLELARKPRALEITGNRHATFQTKIKQGLLPTPVKITERCSAWPIHELDAVNRAIVAGQTPDQIKFLVTELVNSRRAAASGLKAVQDVPYEAQQPEPRPEPA